MYIQCTCSTLYMYIHVMTYLQSSELCSPHQDLLVGVNDLGTDSKSTSKQCYMLISKINANYYSISKNNNSFMINNCMFRCVHTYMYNTIAYTKSIGRESGPGGIHVHALYV